MEAAEVSKEEAVKCISPNIQMASKTTMDKIVSLKILMAITSIIILS